jgi:hypothetical protein
MDGKNNELPKALGDAYKDLTLKMRVRVNKTASKLLELQKENNAFTVDAGDPSLDDGRGNGE